MAEVIATGRTVEEATEAGCAQLGKRRDEVSVEILELPSKKLFKTIPAQVRVSTMEELELEDDFGEEESTEKPVLEASPKEAAPEVKTEAEAKVEQAPAAERILEQEEEEAIDPENEPAVKRAVEYLSAIFGAMGVNDITITAVRQGDATLLRVEGEGIQENLETRGETVQALSYLTDRTVNRGVDKKEENYLRVRLDVAGYRNRREKELVLLAQRTGNEVAKTKRSRTLAPMNPYERLIIHTTISKIEGVASESIGSDTERRVVVKSTAPDAKEGEDWQPGQDRGGHGGRPKPGRGHNGGHSGHGGHGGHGGRGNDRGNDRNRSGGNRDRDRGGNQPRSSTPEREYVDKPRDTDAGPVVPKRRDAVNDGDDLPLYGKIEI